jgi:hypothetical protein
MRIQLATLLCASLLAACGGDDVDARDYDGTWLLTSMTIPTEAGETTLTREGTPTSVRGDVVIAATGDTSAAMHVRQIGLELGVPATEVMSQDMAVEVEEGRWVLTEDGGQVTVFAVALHGDEHLVLTYDPEDSRNTAENPPREVQAMRATPWGRSLVGTWDAVSMQVGTTSMQMNTCTAIGDRWYQVQASLTVDEWLVSERTLTAALYSDAGCTQVMDSNQFVQTGLAEEEGPVLRTWSIEVGGDEPTPLHEAYTVGLADSTLTLTRTGCLPMPSCESDGPSVVVAVRR